MGIEFRFYREVAEKFVDLLEEDFGEQLVSVVLYGSVARGNAKPESDIDILLVIDGLPDSYHARLDSLYSLEEQLKEGPEYRRMSEEAALMPCLSYIVFSKTEAQENRYIYLDMIEDAIILYDRNSFFSKKLDQMRLRLKELGSQKVHLDDGTWYWDLKPDLKLGEVFTL